MLLLLFLVLGLDHGDRAAVGAMAPVLKRVFDISNAQIGQLAAAVSIVGALATVPIGILTDRVSRTRRSGTSSSPVSRSSPSCSP